MGVRENIKLQKQKRDSTSGLWVDVRQALVCQGSVATHWTLWEHIHSTTAYKKNKIKIKKTQTPSLTTTERTVRKKFITKKKCLVPLRFRFFSNLFIYTFFLRDEIVHKKILLSLSGRDLRQLKRFLHYADSQDVFYLLSHDSCKTSTPLARFFLFLGGSNRIRCSEPPRIFIRFLYSFGYKPPRFFFKISNILKSTKNKISLYLFSEQV